MNKCMQSLLKQKQAFDQMKFKNDIMTGLELILSVSLVFFSPIFPKWCLFSWPFTLFQVPVGNENQQVVQQQYQQQVMVPVSQSVQGPMPVYYSVITPTQQNSTRYV